MTDVRRGYAQVQGRCKAGHIFTPENTYQRPDKRKECRTCQRKKELRQMSKKQTRRTVSFNASVFRRMRIKARQEGVSLASWCERVIEPRIVDITDPGPDAPPITVTNDRPEEPEVWSEKRALADAAFGGARFSG